jgi:hypothetical protein
MGVFGDAVAAQVGLALAELVEDGEGLLCPCVGHSVLLDHLGDHSGHEICLVLGLLCV